MFSRFWSLKEWEGLGESINKEKFFKEILFQIRLNELLKYVKIIPAYEKADAKQQKMKEVVAKFWYFFCKKCLQNLK